MAKYSDWRTDLREVMDDDTDSKKVTGKGVNNNKLIKINPKLGEAVEVLGGQILEVSQIEDKESDKDFKDDAEVKKLEQQKKKEDQLKKRIIRMKLRGLNQGSGDTLVAGHEPEGEVLDERLGGRGYSRSAMKSSIHPPSRQSTGDWEDSDRGKGNKARRRAGEKVEKKSPTYRAYVLNKEEKECKGRHPRDQKELDRAEAFIKKNPNFGKKVNEGVMKFIKDRVGGKKKSEKKAEMDKTTEKLHTWRKSTSDKQKEHEKYVNFLPVDEEVVTELNRYGKETGKATGSLNKRPGSPVATRNEPGSAVNIVRRMIRKDTGRPEGQQKKVKGAKGLAQPGDRRFTPAQTISRMRAQVAAADAAMRDTRGT